MRRVSPREKVLLSCPQLHPDRSSTLIFFSCVRRDVVINSTSYFFPFLCNQKKLAFFFLSKNHSFPPIFSYPPLPSPSPNHTLRTFFKAKMSQILSTFTLCTFFASTVALSNKGNIDWIASTGATPATPVVSSVYNGISDAGSGRRWIDVPAWLKDADMHTLVGTTQAGSTLRMDCPATNDERWCHFVFMYYKCETCVVAQDGGVPALLLAEGFAAGLGNVGYYSDNSAPKRTTVYYGKMVRSGTYVDITLTEQLKHAGVWDLSDGTCGDGGEEVLDSPVFAFNSEYPSGQAIYAIDGDLNKYWNGGHVSGWDTTNWLVLDLGFVQPVRKFIFYSYGDTTHDVKDWELQAGDTGTGPWVTVTSGVGLAGYSGAQKTLLDGTARYWRFMVLTRHSQYQCWVREVQLLS